MNVDKESERRRSVFRNSYINLALPLYAFSEPVAPKSHSFLGKAWTEWDEIVVENGDRLSLREVIDLLKSRDGINVVLMSHGTRLLYANFLQEEKRMARLHMTCREIVEMLTSTAVEEKVKSLRMILAAEDDDGNDLDVPDLKLIL